MALGPRLEFRQTQSLVMTPQLRQAIKLLQFSNLEVAAYVEEELERNPLLERDERSDAPIEMPALDQRGAESTPNDLSELAQSGMLVRADAAPLDAEHAEAYDTGTSSDGYGAGRGGSLSFESDERGIDELVEARRTLRDSLAEQLRLSFGDAQDRMIGAALIALLEPSGRLGADPAGIAQALGTTLERVESVRYRMQRFDPAGMFCRSLQECLAVQLSEHNRLDPAMQALLDNLELLARRDMRRLMQVCGVDYEDLCDMIGEVRALDPKPGAGHDAALPQTIVPDVLLRPTPDGGWNLELNSETLPRVLVNQSFVARLPRDTAREARSYIAEHLASANWLVRSLHQRAQTILKVAAEIVRQQDGFFRHGVGHLRPLILRDIAAEVELHESTVSRVTSNKYIGTPRGTFELKYFFTTAIAGTDGESHSAEAVRHRIRALIGAEAAEDVLSDDAIVAILRREGVDIARRTVAKYREALRIPSSVQRRREKAVPA
jgi:RNA polymerase sigma-54 factor